MRACRSVAASQCWPELMATDEAKHPIWETLINVDENVPLFVIPGQMANGFHRTAPKGYLDDTVLANPMRTTVQHVRIMSNQQQIVTALLRGFRRQDAKPVELTPPHLGVAGPGRG